MDLDDLTLGESMDLLELLNLMTLTKEFNVVEGYTDGNIRKGPGSKFPSSDYLKNLEKCFAMRMETLAESLMISIGYHIEMFVQLEEVRLLSATMILRLFLLLYTSNGGLNKLKRHQVNYLFGPGVHGGTWWGRHEVSFA